MFYADANKTAYDERQLLAEMFKRSRVKLLTQRHFHQESTALFRGIFLAFVAEEICTEYITTVIRCDTIRDAILTCAQMPTWFSLICRNEPTTKNEKEKKLKSKKTDMLRHVSKQSGKSM